MQQEYRPTNALSNIPVVVKNLLILNIILFAGKELYFANSGIDLSYPLGEHFLLSSDFRIWQPITCMFMHGNLPHLFLNMFALYMFGSILERYWNPKKFLVFYMVCGLGASATDFGVSYLRLYPHIKAVNEYVKAPTVDKFRALQFKEGIPVTPEMAENYTALLNEGKEKEMLEQSVDYVENTFKPDLYNSLPPSIGASGAIFGLLLAFAMIFPDVKLMLIFFPVPIKAKYFVVIYGLIELGSGLARIEGDNIGHFAHLGGMLFGFILLMYWRNRDKRIYH